MKVAPKVIFLFRDTKGFASAISDAFRSNPPAPLRCLEGSFELSLEGYGIKDQKPSGSVFHFANAEGTYQVSLVIMQHYEPPVLTCAVNEVLSKIAGDKSSLVPKLYVPIILDSSQLKGESKTESGALVYGIQIGQEREINEALLSKIVKPPSTLRIQHETLACCLHLLNVLKLPTFFLIGKTGQNLQNKSTEEFEITHTIGEILGSATGLNYSKDRVTWNPTKTSRDSKEPWLALYGVLISQKPTLLLHWLGLSSRLRCTCVFEHAVPDPTLAIERASPMRKSHFQEVLIEEHPILRPPRTEVLWQKPQACDGMYSSKQRKAAIGVICKDSEGSFLKGWGESTLAGGGFLDEFMAISKAIKMASEWEDSFVMQAFD